MKHMTHQEYEAWLKKKAEGLKKKQNGTSNKEQSGTDGVLGDNKDSSKP